MKSMYALPSSSKMRLPSPARHREARVEREGLEAGRHVALLELDDLLRARPDLEALAGRLGHRGDSARARTARPAARRCCAAATGRKRAKLGQAFRSMTEMAPSSRDDRVAAVDVQAERRGGPRRRRRPARPGRTGSSRASGRGGRTTGTRRAGPRPRASPGHAVELDQVARHVVLHDGAARCRAPRGGRGCAASAVGVAGEADVARLGRVHVAALDPAGARKRGRGPRPSSTRTLVGKRHAVLLRRARSCARGRCCGCPPARLTIRAPRRSQAASFSTTGDALAHDEEIGRHGRRRPRPSGSSSGDLSSTSKPRRSSSARRRAQDLGVVGLAARASARARGRRPSSARVIGVSAQ